MLAIMDWLARLGIFSLFCAELGMRHTHAPQLGSELQPFTRSPEVVDHTAMSLSTNWRSRHGGATGNYDWPDL
jgi:hypothetical protein